MYDPFEVRLVYFYIVATVLVQETSLPSYSDGDTHAELIDAYGMGYKR
jgi:hypothetical protein